MRNGFKLQVLSFFSVVEVKSNKETFAFVLEIRKTKKTTNGSGREKFGGILVHLTVRS